MNHKKGGPAGDPRKELARLIEAAAPRWNRRQVFTDFLELAALSISNAVDKPQFEAREARYLKIAGNYPREDFERFPAMLACLTLAMQQCRECGELEDVLGSLYMEHGLGNDGAGQYFTPFEVSRLMAGVLVGDGAQARDRGLVGLLEPACGAGGMVIATADALWRTGLNYQQILHATCVDIDQRCVHMTYLQLSLLHIPAVVQHGNSISGETWSQWVTPAHVLGGWAARLAAWRRQQEDTAPTPAESSAPAGAPPPTESRRTPDATPPAEGQMDLFGD